MNQKKHSPISALPLEVKQHVLKFVSGTNRDAVRLVSRDWREASDFAFGKRSFFAYGQNTYEETIKSLGGHGGLQLIDKLVVDYCDSWNDTKQRNLQDFICAIPRNQLKIFRYRKRLGFHTIKALFERQQHLSLFSVANVVVHEPDETTSLSEIGGLLSSCEQLQDFHLGINTRSVHEYEEQRSIVLSLPNLRSLSVDFMNAREPGLFFNCPNQPTRVFVLEYLQLSQMDLCTTTFSILNHVVLSKLVVLKLCYIRSGTDVFLDLAASFQSLGDRGTSMKSLEVTLAENGTLYRHKDGIEVLVALETMIQSFRGLHDLIIDTATYGLIRHCCIEHHAPSLRNLYVHAYRLVNAQLNPVPRPFRYTLEEFRSVMNLAENLETLGIALPPETPQTEPYRYSRRRKFVLEPEYQQWVDVIAVHKKLRALRILPPVYENFKIWTEHILYHFERQGCLLELLAFISHLNPSVERKYWTGDDVISYYTFKSGFNSELRQLTTAISFQNARKTYSEWELMFRGFGDVPRL